MPIKVVHFHNGSGGGVLSVIRNLLEFKQHDEIENHIIYTINKEQIAHYNKRHLEGAASEQVFYYSPKWNFYYTCRQLAKLLPDDKSVIVAHDWLELGMVSNLGLKNPVVFFLHGNYNYYYQLAGNNANAIDNFICVSPVIFNELSRRYPLLKNYVYKRYFPVPNINDVKKSDGPLNIFYGVGDLHDKNKKFPLLVKVDAFLRKANCIVNWNIVGKGIEDKDIALLIHSLQNVKHYSNLENKSLLSLLKDMHIFLLPSEKEGLPVSLVESMKAGLVPLVTNWNNATEELLIDNTNGYYISLNDAQLYADKIIYFNQNRVMLNSFSESAIIAANRLFDPILNTDLIEKVFFNAFDNKKNNKIRKKVYGSRLDHPLIPNIFTKTIRTVFK